MFLFDTKNQAIYNLDTTSSIDVNFNTIRIFCSTGELIGTIELESNELAKSTLFNIYGQLQQGVKTMNI